MRQFAAAGVASGQTLISNGSPHGGESDDHDGEVGKPWQRGQGKEGDGWGERTEGEKHNEGKKGKSSNNRAKIFASLEAALLTKTLSGAFASVHGYVP